jgi:hypothetical protein
MFGRLYLAKEGEKILTVQNLLLSLCFVFEDEERFGHNNVKIVVHENLETWPRRPKDIGDKDLEKLDHKNWRIGDSGHIDL